MLTQDPAANWFDIAAVWLTPEQLTKVKRLGFEFEYAEERLDLDDLIEIVDTLGTIDYSRTQREWYSFTN